MKDEQMPDWYVFNVLPLKKRIEKLEKRMKTMNRYSLRLMVVEKRSKNNIKKLKVLNSL